MGKISPQGYGRVGYSSVASTRHGQQQAHRVAYALTYGSIPEDRPYVLHRCDNRPCCNPSHLWPGTKAENNRDRAEKGRSAKAWKPTRSRVTSVIGENHGMAKLTEADVVAIRNRYASGDATMTAIAEDYGMTKVAIRHVVRRMTWRHVA